MKATDRFKEVINEHLHTVAKADELFAGNFNNPKKNIDDCVTYILNTVKKSGQAGFADEEVFNMAIHYYDEENIEVGEPVSGKVVVNHHIEKPKAVEPKPVAAPAKPLRKKTVDTGQDLLFS